MHENSLQMCDIYGFMYICFPRNKTHTICMHFFVDLCIHNSKQIHHEGFHSSHFINAADKIVNEDFLFVKIVNEDSRGHYNAWSELFVQSQHL